MANKRRKKKNKPISDAEKQQLRQFMDTHLEVNIRLGHLNTDQMKEYSEILDKPYFRDAVRDTINSLNPKWAFLKGIYGDSEKTREAFVSTIASLASGSYLEWMQSVQDQHSASLNVMTNLAAAVGTYYGMEVRKKFFNQTECESTTSRRKPIKNKEKKNNNKEVLSEEEKQGLSKWMRINLEQGLEVHDLNPEQLKTFSGVLNNKDFQEGVQIFINQLGPKWEFVKQTFGDAKKTKQAFICTVAGVAGGNYLNHMKSRPNDYPFSNQELMVISGAVGSYHGTAVRKKFFKDEIWEVSTSGRDWTEKNSEVV